MITILCRSSCLASELSAIIGSEQTIVFPSGSGNISAQVLSEWLENCLRKYPVSAVLYETRFFVDPAHFREISPGTRFVVLSAPGDEPDTQTAIVCGACAVISKPISAQDVHGVLALVSN